MKKNLLILLATLFCAAASVRSSSAQGQQVINFGVKAGVNLAYAGSLTNFSTEGGMNFTGGVFLEFRPLRFIGINAEALYRASNFDITGDIIDGVNTKLNVKLNAIDVPIMAKLYLIGGLSVNVGVMPTFLLPSGMQTSEGQELDTDFNSVGVSIPVGLSCQLGFGLLLDLRYNFGLTNINSISEIGTLTHNITENMKGETIALTLGWRF
ncbi:MAG: porin family protein [Rikenellaceae bacterium]